MIKSNVPPFNKKKEKVLRGEGRCQVLLDAESELVSIAGLLWDRDVIPGTQTREEANKGEQRPTEGRSWGVAPQGSLTKKDLQR